MKVEIPQRVRHDSGEKTVKSAVQTANKKNKNRILNKK